jgi:hypothetical protein
LILGFLCVGKFIYTKKEKMEQMKTITNPYVSTHFEGEDLVVSWGFSTLKRIVDGGKLLCYIPGFDMYFMAANEEMAAKKAEAMTGLLMDHFFIHSKKQGLKLFALEMRKKGFKTEKDLYTIGQFVKNIPTAAKFKTKATRPPEFADAEEFHQESKMTLAV